MAEDVKPYYRPVTLVEKSGRWELQDPQQGGRMLYWSLHRLKAEAYAKLAGWTIET